MRLFARSVSVLAGSLLLAPAVFAHEHQEFTIGNARYGFVVGSINEPVAVDDKSGVELTITKLADAGTEHAETAGEDHSSDSGVTGLEQTLEVEISAGGNSKRMKLSPAYGEPGGYKAVFIPTVQTTYSYRVFGTINAVPFDVTFTCNPAGHPRADDDKTSVSMGPQVTRTLKSGAFGCPVAKADLGFPEPAPTLYDLSEKSGGGMMGLVGAISGVLALVLSAFAWKRSSGGMA